MNLKKSWGSVLSPFGLAGFPGNIIRSLSAISMRRIMCCFYECHSDEHYVWGGYFAPRVYVTEVEAACLSFHFERVYIPDSFEGTPEAAWQEASGRLREYEQEEASFKEAASGYAHASQEKAVRSLFFLKKLL